MIIGQRRNKIDNELECECEVECPECEGAGVIYIRDKQGNINTSDTKKCNACNGTGQIKL